MKLCSVCSGPAIYEVRLYDEYHYGSAPEVFDEQDYTCPFLCETHKAQNEREAVGIRRPRGLMRYPFTNRYGAQGFTKYRPIEHAVVSTALH